MSNFRRSFIKEKIIRLPNEYQEVEYLKSDGYAYIWSGITQHVNTVNDVLSCEVKAKLNSTASDKWVLGTWPYNDNGNFLYGSFHTKLAIHLYNSKSYDNIPVDTDIHIVKINTLEGSFIDDKKVGDFVKPNLSYNSQIKIFGSNHVNEREYYFNAQCTIYYCKFWINGIILRDFVPCYRKSDNKPGLYDLAGSKCSLTNSPFYIKTGTSEFTVGPAIN